jgi:hypothetical protein
VALKAYVSPGVTVDEAPSPTLAPFLPTPTIVAIVGESAGTQTASERLILSGTTPVTLKNTGVVGASTVVTTAASGAVVDPGNYTVAQSADPDSTVTGDESYTIVRVPPPSAALTAVTGGTGALTGTYRYKYAFVNAAGETGPSPATGDIVIAAAGYNLSNIAVGPSGTTARTVYREKVVAGVGQGYHLVATIANNSATTLTNEATTDAAAATAPAPKNGIADPDTVVVTYTYTDEFYFEPTLFEDYDDIADKYGAPYDTNGLVSSKLTFAARLAFLNGARDVIAVATRGSADTDYDAALAKLLNEEHANIVVVTKGSTTTIASLKAHVDTMVNMGHYRFGIAAQDGSTSVVPAATLRTAAQAQNDQALQYLNVSSLRTQNPVTGREIDVGGQYATAAIAGMWAGREVAFPLTGATVAGFTGINDKRTSAERALDSNAGLLVIEEKSKGTLSVRHSVTTAIGDVNWREGSVVRAKFHMAERVGSGLQGLIGTVAAPAVAASIVRSAVAGVLEQLVVEQVIASYQDVKARSLTGDPTTIEVRFAYSPLYPINNILVIFTVNPNTGDFTFNV